MPKRQSVPLLREKLRVLEKLGGMNLEEIAEEVGKSKNTLLGWGDGGTSEANTVPAASYLKLIDAIAQRITDLQWDEVERLLLSATARELEAHYGVEPPPDLLTVLESRAERGVGLLHRKTLGLIETESSVLEAKSDYEVALGAYFRIEIPRNMRGWHVFALQYGGRQWGVVPHSIDPVNGHVHLPGLLGDGGYDFMREMTAVGINSFFVVGTKKQLSKHVTDAVASAVIETDQQQTIGSFVDQIKARSCLAVSVRTLVK